MLSTPTGRPATTRAPSAAAAADAGQTAPLETPAHHDCKQTINHAMQMAPKGTEDGKIKAILTDKVLDDLCETVFKPIFSPAPTASACSDARIKAFCQLTGHDQRACDTLLVQFRYVNGSSLKDSSVDDFVVKLLCFYCAERQAAFDILAAIIRTVLTKHASIKERFQEVAEDALTRIIARHPNFAERVTKAYAGALSEDIPKPILDYNERYADTLAAVWAAENLWELALLVQMACLLTRLGRIPVSHELLALFCAKKIPDGALKLRIPNETIRHVMAWLQTLQVLFPLMAIDLSSLVTLYPDSGVSRLPVAFAEVEKCINAVASAPACSMVVAVYVGLCDYLGVAGVPAGLQSTFPHHFAQACRSGALSMVTDVLQKKWVLSSGALGQGTVLNPLIERIGHDFLMSFLSVFDVASLAVGEELVSLHVAVFAGSPELADEFWLLDAPRPERTAVLSKLIGEFPLSVAPLARLLSALATTPASARYVFDLLRHGRNLRTLTLERIAGLGLVEEVYDGAADGMRLTVKGGRPLECEHLGAKIVLPPGTTGRTARDFSGDRPVAEWSIGVDGWQLMARILQANSSQSTTGAIVLLFRAVMSSRSLASELDRIVSGVAPVFTEAALPAAASRQGSLPFVLVQCIRREFARDVVSLSTISAVLWGLRSFLLTAAAGESEPFLGSALDGLAYSPGIFDLAKSFLGLRVDAHRLELLVDLFDFLAAASGGAALIALGKGLARTFIPRVNSLQLGSVDALFDLWAAVCRFVRRHPELMTHEFVAHCYQCLYHVASAGPSLDDICTALLEAVRLNAASDQFQTLLGARTNSGSLFDHVTCEALELSAAPPSLWDLQCAVLERYPGVSPSLLYTLGKILAGDPRPDILSLLRRLCSLRPELVASAPWRQIRPFCLRSVSLTLALYGSPVLRPLVDGGVRKCAELWDAVVKSDVSDEALALMTAELSCLLNAADCGDAALPSRVNAVPVETLLRLGRPSLHALSEFVQAGTLASNARLLFGFTDDAKIINAVPDVIDGQCPRFVADAFAMLDVLLRYGPQAYTPPPSLCIQLLSIVESVCAEDECAAFDVIGSAASVAAMIRGSVSADETQVLSSLLLTLGRHATRATSSAQLERVLCLIVGLTPFLDAASAGVYRALLPAVLQFPSGAAFAALAQAALLKPFAAEAMCDPLLIALSDRVGRLHVAGLRDFLTLLSALAVHSPSSIPLLITAVMQLDPLRCTMSAECQVAFVLLLTGMARRLSSPLVDAFLANVCLPHLVLRQLCAVVSSESSCYSHALVLPSLQLLVAIVLNGEAAAATPRLVRESLFPHAVDNALCPIGLAADLQRVAHQALLCGDGDGEPAAASVVECILLLLMAIRGDADSILAELAVHINSSCARLGGSGRWKAVVALVSPK